jgi:hypothetical protein
MFGRRRQAALRVSGGNRAEHTADLVRVLPPSLVASPSAEGHRSQHSQHHFDSTEFFCSRDGGHAIRL